MNQYMLLLLVVVMIGFMWWSSNSRKKQMQKMEQDKRDQLAAVKPGEWVRTRVGFWGRFVDLDGDIVVLETTGGHEMYWEREMIAEIGGQPPLQDAERNEGDQAPDAAQDAQEEAVLGLDETGAESSFGEDTDEKQN